MNIGSIINFLIAYGALQAIFIVIVILRQKGASTFRSLFALFLLIEGVTLFERFLVEAELIHSLPHILGVSYPISFLKPPLILFMTYSLTKATFKMRRMQYLHFLPFLVVFLFNIPFYFFTATEKIDWVSNFMNTVPNYQSFAFYFGIAMFAYIGTYLYLGVVQLRRFRQYVKNNTLVNWFLKVLLIYGAFLAFHFTYFSLEPLGDTHWPYVNQISMLLMTFIIQSVALKLMDKSLNFEIKPPDLSNVDHRKRKEELILNKFEVDKIFRDDTLSLTSFAESVQLPSQEVSQIVNQKFNCSFAQLVTRYRLREAKQLLQNPETSHLRLIEIAYAVGFTNKVSFYRAFKKFEGISPSAYLDRVAGTNKGAKKVTK